MLRLLVGAFLTCACSVDAIAQAAGTPPHVLNVTRVRLKPQSSAAYGGIEAQVTRAFERARLPVYWIALQAPRDANDILYLNLFDSRDDLARATQAYREASRQHPDLQELQHRLEGLTASQTSLLTTRRDDVERSVNGVDFATMRTIRMTTFQVRPGREGEFIEAIRTANPKDGPWLVYEANDSPTFLLLTLTRTRISRRAGAPIPRSLRRYRGVYTKAETRIYSVRPAMSHVPRAFAQANPLFRRAPGGTKQDGRP